MKTPEEITRWCDMMLKHHPNIEDTNFFNSIKNYMKDQRPQGKWIFRSGITCGGYYKCNKCGEVERAEKNFCPSCGAKIRGKEE